MSSALLSSFQDSPRDFDRASALNLARAILRHHGKSYYYSTCLFPRDKQEATWAVYAFVRLPDEIVDSSPQNTPEEQKMVREQLEEFRGNWREAYSSGVSSDPILQLNALIWRELNMPFDYSEAFLSAMIQDTHQSEYANYAELEGYMYGSAAVIGLMMSHLIGFSGGETTLRRAEKLGYAMQLTNFLRDVDEDFQQRGRVYLPADELAQFGLSRDDVAARRFSPAFRELMRYQAERAHRLYEESAPGIPFLAREGRLAVATASTLYRAILRKLEAQDFNPFARRAATSLPEKLWLTGRAWKLSRVAHS